MRASTRNPLYLQLGWNNQLWRKPRQIVTEGETRCDVQIRASNRTIAGAPPDVVRRVGFTIGR